jgi:hypothetical protein
MLLQGKPPAGWIVRECCLLQLRMLCELIALGCLVAHGDIAETHSKRLRKEYSADAIMSEMTKLHAKFFPVPVQQQIDAATRTDLCTLYARCGDGLHKGNAKKILDPMDPKPDNSDLGIWTKKIHGLLSMHMTYLIGDDSYMIGSLRRAQSGKAGVAFAAKEAPSS